MSKLKTSEDLTEPLTPLEFQRTVLAGVETLEEKFEEHKTGVQKILSDPERLPKELKEDLNNLKKHANDITKAMAQLTKIQSQLRLEAKHSFGTPVQRIERNPQLRGLLNMMIRAATPNGEWDRQVEELAARADLDKITPQVCRSLMSRGETTPIQKAIGEDTGEGSTLIIAQLYKEIYDTLAEYGEWATLGVRRLGTKVTNFPVKTARPVANFLTSEGAAIADDTNYAGNTVTQTVLPIAVLLLVSKQLLEDSEFDVTAPVMGDFSEAHNLRLDNASFNGAGNGGALDGNFTGMFNGGTAVVAGAGATQANLTKYDDWAKLMTSVAPIVLKRNPKFWMHPFMLIRAMQVKDNNGRPIFLGALDGPKLNSGALGSILGCPVISCMAAPSTNAPSQPICAFGDGNGQVVGIRDDFVFEFSDHYAWNTLQRAFRAYSRASTGTRASNAFGILQTSAN